MVEMQWLKYNRYLDMKVLAVHSCKDHEALWNIPEDTQKLQQMELGHMLAAHLMEEAGKERRTKLVVLDTPSLLNLIGFLSRLKHIK